MQASKCVFFSFLGRIKESTSQSGGFGGADQNEGQIRKVSDSIKELEAFIRLG
jgi:hypothetical protein